MNLSFEKYFIWSFLMKKIVKKFNKQDKEKFLAEVKKRKEHID